MRVAAYPWASLERLPRQPWRDARTARRAVARAIRVEALGKAATAMLSVETHLVLGEVTLDSLPADGEGVGLELSDGALVWMVLEPALAAAIVGRVLGRPAGISAPGTALDPALSGAVAAILIEVARRSGADEALAYATRPIAPGSSCVRVSATVLFDGKPYAARCWVLPSASVAAAAPPTTLADLGDLEVSLRLVAALSLASPDELATVRIGDAWLPGAGWWIDAHGAGRAALAAPRGERGIAVSLAPDGGVVVGDDVVELGLDAEDAMSSGRNEVGGALTDAVLDAPVVVRVEVGAVSLSAREWAALRPGDVIETGRRINDPVVLRVAGREVARGELVEVEGELGVRIRELVSGGTP